MTLYSNGYVTVGKENVYVIFKAGFDPKKGSLLTIKKLVNYLATLFR